MLAVLADSLALATRREPQRPTAPQPPLSRKPAEPKNA